VVDDDGLAVECALFVGVGGQLNRLDGAGLFGDDGPEVSVVAGNAEGQQSFKGAGVKVGKENGSGVRGQRVVVVLPLAVMFSSRPGVASVFGLGAAVTVTAESLTMALNWTWRRRSAGERRSDLERV